MQSGKEALRLLRNSLHAKQFSFTLFVCERIKMRQNATGNIDVSTAMSATALLDHKNPFLP